jgi:hypothetical protein
MNIVFQVTRGEVPLVEFQLKKLNYKMGYYILQIRSTAPNLSFQAE